VLIVLSVSALGCGSASGNPLDASNGHFDASNPQSDSGPRPDTGPRPDSGALGHGGNLTCGGSSFLDNAPFYQDISGADVDASSSDIITALEDDDGWAPAGTRFRQDLGIDFSFVINCADPSVGPTTLALNDPGVTADGSDTAPVPLPAGGEIEGGAGYSCDGGDCHLIVYQGTRLYEVYQANLAGSVLEGGFLAVWDLTHDYWDESQMGAAYSRGEHCDGGNGGDLPIAPKLLTAEELNAALAGDGVIHHALRFTIPNEHIEGNVYVHPATHTGRVRQPTNGFLPYGARLRLRTDYDLSSLPNDAARVIARTLQHYGMYLDDGGNIFISATTDAQAVLGGNDVLGALQPRDFEMIDGGQRIVWGTYDCMHTTVTN